MALAHPGQALADRDTGAVLRVHLHDAAGCLRGGEDLRAFPQVVGDGLLVQHVLSRLHRPDALHGVQMVRRADRDRVDVLAREQVAVVDDEVGLLAARLGRRLLAIEHRGVDVAERDDLHAGDLRELGRELLAAAVEAGDREADGIVGTDHLRPGAGRRTRPSRRRRWWS
jgi:hypothetical protein